MQYRLCWYKGSFLEDKKNNNTYFRPRNNFLDVYLTLSEPYNKYRFYMKRDSPSINCIVECGLHLIVYSSEFKLSNIYDIFFKHAPPETSLQPIFGSQCTSWEWLQPSIVYI